MNILYLADPGSIHDVRWINFFAEKNEFNCFVLVRKCHQLNVHSGNRFNSRVRIVSVIEDPSTVRPFRTFVQYFRIRRLIRRFKIQLMHLLYAEPNALWANGRFVFGIPVMLTTHGTDVLKTIPSFFCKKTVLSMLVARQYRNAFGRCDAVACTSHDQIDSLGRMKVNLRRPPILIRMGVDFSQVVNVIPDNSLAETIGKAFVLMPRNMKPLYLHEFTLDAISLLDESIREKYAFVFISAFESDDQYGQGICQKAESIDADVRFVPPMNHEQLLALMKRSSLVVMNPGSDGSPASAMEAMACRKPVILPPLEYDLEVFGNAFFFHEWTPEALKLTIEAVLQMDKRQLDQRLELGLQTVRARADFHQEMSKIEVIYQKLVADAVA